MSSAASQRDELTGARHDACWNRIGIGGDRSCPELPRHAHCRNCPAYSSGARALLNRPVPADYAQYWTRHHAQAAPRIQAQSQSAIVFRIGAEWFALPTRLCVEAASLRTIHTLPHRRRGALLGLANVRGELVVCIALSVILRIDAGAARIKAGAARIDAGAARTEAGSASRGQRDASPERLLVASWPDGLIAFPVNEVQGVHRFRPDEIQAAPATIAQSPSTFSKGLLACGAHTAGLLDDAALKRAIDRSLG